MDRKQSPLPLPGYGLPITWTPAPCSMSEKHARLQKGETEESMFHGTPLFPSGWHLSLNIPCDDLKLPWPTNQERNMIRLMNQITETSGWESTVCLESMVKDRLAVEAELSRFRRLPATPNKATLNYIVQELQYKAKIFKNTGLVASNDTGVVKSDVAVPRELLESLRAAVIPLEKKVREENGGHQWGALDIVDPDLYNVRLGKTRVIEDGVLDRHSCLRRIGQGLVIPQPEDEESYQTLLGSYRGPNGILCEDYRTYGKAQWLPCDVDISGDTPRILTYVNNVHPIDYAPLYGVFENILAKVIPAWNMTLTPLRAFDFKLRIKCEAPDYGDLDEWMSQNGPKKEDFLDSQNSDDDFRERYNEVREEVAMEFLRHPQVSEGFREPNASSKPVDLRTEYKDRGLQIVVRMRAIYLPPEGPQAAGPRWPLGELEGIPNDHICAVANYYYDVENMDTKPWFYQPEKGNFDLLKANKQWDGTEFEWLEPIFGACLGSPSAQTIASLEIPEGRLITFPNLLLHEYDLFRVADKTKPGHCKVLTFLLVDPNIRVISSAIVPGQRFDWWVKEVVMDGGGLDVFPYELRLEIVRHIPGWNWERFEFVSQRERIRRAMSRRVSLPVIDGGGSRV